MSERAVELAWRAHPLRERAGVAVLATLLILALAAAVFALSRSPALSLLAGFALILALHRFYFPSRFEIDEEGISARYLLRRQRYRWSSVRRFLCDRQGGYLSTRTARSWFDAYSGLTVLFGRHRDEVIRLIRKHMDEARNR